MSLVWCDVEALLITELPEFADVVREYREFMGDDPSSYLVMGVLFNFVVDSLRNKSAENARDLAHRTYALVERVLTEGDRYSQDCVAIEMIEPLTVDGEHMHYPNLEEFMGPAAIQELKEMREWAWRYGAMKTAVAAANEELGSDVFDGVGLHKDAARVIADQDKWMLLPQSKRDDAFRSLRRTWMELRGLPIEGRDSGLEITGTREKLFAVLAGDDLL